MNIRERMNEMPIEVRNTVSWISALPLGDVSTILFRFNNNWNETHPSESENVKSTHNHLIQESRSLIEIPDLTYIINKFIKIKILTDKFYP